MLCCVQLFGSPMDFSPPGSFIQGILQARIPVGCHFLLQGVFLIQRVNLSLLPWPADCLLLSHRGSPRGDRLHTQGANEGSHTMRLRPEAVMEWSLSQTHLLLLKGLTDRQEATGTDPRVTDDSGSRSANLSCCVRDAGRMCCYLIFPF